MRVRVLVRPKPGILDPQGQAVGNALAGLGFQGIGGVRQGKLIEIELVETEPARARQQAEAMCKQLLANPVTEEYAIEIMPSG
jgi:phosphoribosylformylglycinamidine synthase subunit PurS